MAHHGPVLTVKMQAEYTQFLARKLSKVAPVYYTSKLHSESKKQHHFIIAITLVNLSSILIISGTHVLLVR